MEQIYKRADRTYILTEGENNELLVRRYHKHIGNINYRVRSIFDRNATVTAEEKLKKLVEREAEKVI